MLLKNRRGRALYAILIVLVLIFFFVLLSYFPNEQTSLPSPNVSLQSVLDPFFRNIPTVKWVVYNGKQVYVGFDANFNPERADPLKMIMWNAAKEASKAGHRAIELWAVDANRSNRNWRPETGIEAWMLTKITYSGSVIHVQ